MKNLISLFLTFLLIYSTIFNVSLAGQPATYYSQVTQTVYDKVSGNVTKNYRVGKAVNDLSNAANDYRNVTKTHQARNLANRLRNVATRSNALGLAVTAAVAAVGWGITEIKKDLYDNDIQQYGRSITGTEYKISNVFYDTGWRPSINDAVSNYLENAHGTTVQKQFIELFNNDKNLKYKTINGSSETILNASITSRTEQINEVLQDNELEQLVQEQFTDQQYNEIYAIPDYVPNTIQEIKQIQANIIQEAYPDEIPLGINGSSVTSVQIVPGTAPQITEVTIDETLTDTTPEEIPETEAEPWKEFLPNGNPNPNYDPRTDQNNPLYDPARDPRQSDATDVKDFEEQRKQTQTLEDIRTLQQQQLQQQVQTKQQLQNSNKEATQKRIEGTLNDIAKTLNQTQTAQQQEQEKPKCGGESGVSCEGTQASVLSELKKMTAPQEAKEAGNFDEDLIELDNQVILATQELDEELEIAKETMLNFLTPIQSTGAGSLPCVAVDYLFINFSFCPNDHPEWAFYVIMMIMASAYFTSFLILIE